MLRIVRSTQACTVALAFFGGGSGAALAGPPAAAVAAVPTSSSSGDAQASAPLGGFFTSLKQAFKHDYDHEVVRGYFDVGSPPDAHRYYCLFDAKTGKRETNGVAGHPVLRPDGMTGIQAGAVSFYSCVAAEQQGILVTKGYNLNAGAGSVIAPAPPAPPASPARRPAAVPEQASVAEPAESEIIAVFERFIAGQNAHDRAVVSDVLLDSKEFVWAQVGGTSIWGQREAVEAFQVAWRGDWRLDPRLTKLRVARVASGVAVLISPLSVTHGDPGAAPSTTPMRWGGVFVKTPSGWRISSIFETLINGSQGPPGG